MIIDLPQRNPFWRHSVNLVGAVGLSLPHQLLVWGSMFAIFGTLFTTSHQEKWKTLFNRVDELVGMGEPHAISIVLYHARDIRQ